MRLVLDTNVVVAALRSPTGASAALLNRAFSGDFTMLISVALVLEYEAVCGQAAQRAVSGLGRDDVRTFITALCRVGEHVNAGSCGGRFFVTRRTKWCWKQRSMGERMRW